MSIINEDYFSMILNRIAKNRNVAIQGLVTEPDNSRAYNRAGLIFALETILHEHRAKFGTLWQPLKGKLALDHLLLQKYKWPLKQIRELSLQDCVLLLQEELSYEALPIAAQGIIKLFDAHRNRNAFPEISEDDWDPNLAESLPPQRHW